MAVSMCKIFAPLAEDLRTLSCVLKYILRGTNGNKVSKQNIYKSQY